jgi:hypothetical protein
LKRDNPFVDALRWVFLGGIIGVILYLAHLFLLHEEKDEVDDHSSYSSGLH